MRRALILLTFLLLPVISLSAQTTTTVTDTLYTPSGVPVTGGTIVLTLSTAFTSGGHFVPTQSIQVFIGSAAGLPPGQFSVNLYPNDTGVPAGTSYTATYNLFNGVTAPPEIWVVPTSASPVNLNTVRTSPAPVPSAIIALSNLAQGGATTGQGLIWSGTSWTPGSITLPSIVTPGTNTKITYNAQGLITAGAQAQFLDIGGQLDITQVPLATNQDILFRSGGALSHLSISSIPLNECLGNNGGIWGPLVCSGGGGGSSIFTSYQFGTQTALTGTGLYLQTTYPSVLTATQTGSGTIGSPYIDAVDLATQSANLVFAGPTSGGAAQPTFRSLVTADFPTSGVSAGTYTVPSITVDATGRITSASTGASATAQLQFLRIKANQGNLTTDEFAGPLWFYAADYNFPAQAPGGSISVGVNTITLTPVPLGLNATDTGHYVRLSAGTGTAEQVLITGGTATSGSASGTITFTAVNTHSGAWTVTSASAGIQEAVVAANGSAVKIPAGTYAVYAPIYVCQATLKGDGMFNTILQAQATNQGIIDAPCQKDTFEDLGFNITGGAAGVAGNYGIRLGNGTGHDNSFTRINRDYFEPLYDAILCINCSQTEVSNNVFYNFGHTGITANDTTNPDSDGPWVRGNVFFNFNSYSTPALACLYATSSGGITFTNNNCYGTATVTNPQLQYNVYINQTASTQAVISNNVLESASVHNIDITGVFNLITIEGNTIAQPGAAQNLWRGIEINGNNTTSFCGTGIGICQFAVTGNTIQGPGSGSTSSVAISIDGFATQGYIGDNALNYTQVGVNTGTNITATTVGPNQITAYSATLFGGSTGTTWINSGAVTFAQLPTAANGSFIYVSNSNSTCTAATGTGQICKRLNNTWTN